MLVHAVPVAVEVVDHVGQLPRSPAGRVPDAGSMIAFVYNIEETIFDRK